jgi:hypothetical protein
MMVGTPSVDLERFAGARALVFVFFWIVPWEDILAVSHNERRRLDLRLYFVRFFKDIVAPIENLKVCYSSS